MSVIVTNARGEVKTNEADVFLQDIRRAQHATLSIMARLNQCEDAVRKHASEDDVEKARRITVQLWRIEDSLQRMVLNAARQRGESG